MPSAVDLAERIARLASDLGISTAVIGAGAMAVHNYVRATNDVDLATSVSPGADLRRLEHALVSVGLCGTLRMPDAEDDLGGVLTIWEPGLEDEDGDPLSPVEIVNFENPHRPRANPARAAITNARPLEQGGALRYVTLPDLVALKLYAGGRRDHADIVDLLVRNADASLDAIRAAASPFDRDNILEQLIKEAAATR